MNDIPEYKIPENLSREDIQKLTDEEIIDYLHDGSGITPSMAGRLICELFMRMKKIYKKAKDEMD